jgi:hypothetical protein
MAASRARHTSKEWEAMLAEGVTNVNLQGTHTTQLDQLG